MISSAPKKALIPDEMTEPQSVMLRQVFWQPYEDL